VWKEDDQFALMHDLTNCLRIGDISVFTDEGPEQIEVKTNAKRHNSVQNRRIRAARNALGRAGPLPGDDRGEWLYDLDLPYRTYLDLLRTGTERAAREGGAQSQSWTPKCCNTSSSQLRQPVMDLRRSENPPENRTLRTPRIRRGRASPSPSNLRR
jgi:hypothetical protein